MKIETLSKRRSSEVQFRFLAAILALSCSCGCIVIPVLTPQPAKIRLDAIDMPARETLVIAGYRDGDDNWISVGHNTPFQYSVVRPRSDDTYITPAILKWELIGWVYVPVAFRQFRPLLLIVCSDGRVAAFDDEPDLRADFPTNHVSAIAIDADHRGKFSPATSQPSLDANAVMGFLACEILSQHDPQDRRPRALTVPRTPISEVDAQLIHEFVIAHASTFSPMTVALWERLANNYGQSAVLDENESGNWSEMKLRFIGRSPVRMALLLDQLPEREKSMLRVAASQVTE